jgi:hypothetical protein
LKHFTVPRAQGKVYRSRVNPIRRRKAAPNTCLLLR